jgi:hypothetical protein
MVERFKSTIRNTCLLDPLMSLLLVLPTLRSIAIEQQLPDNG